MFNIVKIFLYTKIDMTLMLEKKRYFYLYKT